MNCEAGVLRPPCVFCAPTGAVPRTPSLRGAQGQPLVIRQIRRRRWHGDKPRQLSRQQGGSQIWPGDFDRQSPPADTVKGDGEKILFLTLFSYSPPSNYPFIILIWPSTHPTFFNVSV